MHVAFLTCMQAEKKQREIEEIQQCNSTLLASILPTHVIDYFVEQKSSESGVRVLVGHLHLVLPLATVAI